MTIENDKLLLSDCIRHNDCESFVKEFYPLIRYKIKSALSLYNLESGSQEIDDLTQDVFERLFTDDRERLKNFQFIEGGSLRSWLATIAGRTVKNHLRKNGYDGFIWQNKKMVLDDTNLPPIQNGTELIGKLSLDAAGKKLDFRDRVITRLYIYGMPAKEIALIVDGTENEIHKRIYNIKNKIQKLCM